MKLHDPAEFGGDDEDDARHFVMDCDMYLDMNAHVYNTDARKIIYVLSHMRTGTAAAFKEYTVHQAQTKGYPSYQEFKESFQQAFMSSDVKGQAMDKLTKLKQTGRADDYVNRFRMLAARAEITDQEAMLRYFIKGLRPKLANTISKQSTFPSNMEGWYTLAQTLDNHERRFQAILGNTWNYNYKANHTPAAEPMDVDRVKTATIGRLSPAELEEYKKKGLCFYCKEQGHMKNKCPKWLKKQTKVQAVATQPKEEKHVATAVTSGASARVAAIRKIMEGAGEEEKEKVYVSATPGT